MNFLQKMTGAGPTPPRVRWLEILFSFAAAFAGMAVLVWLHEQVSDPQGLPLLMGSLGASAVLVFAAPKSPLAQPRNLLGGHLLSALVGVTVRQVLPSPSWLCVALAVALAIACMHATKTLHPPGGATALLAVTGGQKIYDLGYVFVFFPTLAGALLLLVLALVINNAARFRRYPEYW